MVCPRGIEPRSSGLRPDVSTSFTRDTQAWWKGGGVEPPRPFKARRFSRPVQSPICLPFPSTSHQEFGASGRIRTHNTPSLSRVRLPIAPHWPVPRSWRNRQDSNLHAADQKSAVSPSNHGSVVSGCGGGIRTPDSIPYEGTALPLSYTALEDPVGFEPTCRGLRIRCFPVRPRVLNVSTPFGAPGRPRSGTTGLQSRRSARLNYRGPQSWRPSGELNPDLRIDSPVSWPLNDLGAPPKQG